MLVQGAMRSKKKQLSRGYTCIVWIFPDMSAFSRFDTGQPLAFVEISIFWVFYFHPLLSAPQHFFNFPSVEVTRDMLTSSHLPGFLTVRTFAAQERSRGHERGAEVRVEGAKNKGGSGQRRVAGGRGNPS